MYRSNKLRLICGRFPFQSRKSALRFSLTIRLSFVSPMRKYAAASSMVKVYFSQIGTCTVFILPPFARDKKRGLTLLPTLYFTHACVTYIIMYCLWVFPDMFLLRQVSVHHHSRKVSFSMYSSKILLLIIRRFPIWRTNGHSSWLVSFLSLSLPMPE